MYEEDRADYTNILSLVRALQAQRSTAYNEAMDTQPDQPGRPVDSETLQRLPKHKVLSSADANKLNAENKCAICLEDYRCRQHYTLLQCGHGYHKGCIVKWFKKYNATCPVCRANPFELNTTTATTCTHDTQVGST